MTDLAQLLEYVPVDAAAKAAVIVRLQEPHRRYHDLEHVLEMWRWHHAYHHGVFADLATTQVVASFCLYHDAIYDPQAQDNERQSADLWWRDCDDDSPVCELVDQAILASADHFAPKGLQAAKPPSVAWCLNLDLLRLGVPEDQFTQHGHDIRAEYAHLTERQWIKKSAEFRAKVMAQSNIFGFAVFAPFETQARGNLANALIRDWQSLGYL